MTGRIMELEAVIVWVLNAPRVDIGNELANQTIAFVALAELVEIARRQETALTRVALETSRERMKETARAALAASPPEQEQGT